MKLTLITLTDLTLWRRTEADGRHMLACVRLPAAENQETISRWLGVGGGCVCAYMDGGFTPLARMNYLRGQQLHKTPPSTLVHNLCLSPAGGGGIAS